MIYSSALSGVGTSWQKFLTLGLHLPQSLRDVFLFTGSPDLLIQQESVVVCDQSVMNVSDETVFENCHQRVLLNPDPNLDLPEKLCELLAIQHTVQAAKVLRRFKNRKPLECKFEVNGMLIDKIIGTVESTLMVDLKKSVLSKVQVEICNYQLGILNPMQLCSHFQSLMKRL